MMKIRFTFEADSKTDSEELARLAYLFSGTTALSPVRSITDSTIHAVDGISVTEAKTVVEYPAPEMRAYDAEPAFDFAGIQRQPATPATIGEITLTTTDGQTLTATVTDTPVKKGRKPKGVQTPPPATAGEASGPTDLAAALDTALEAIPGVTELTDTLPTMDGSTAATLDEGQQRQTDAARAFIAIPEVQKRLHENDIVVEQVPVVTLEAEVTVAEDGFDLLGDAEPEAQDPVITEPVSLPDLPGVETMDHAAAGAEIRRLVIKNTGAWLRDILTHYRVNRISDLTLEQSHDAIRNGRVRAGEVAAAA